MTVEETEWEAKTRALITVNEQRRRRRYFDSLGNPSVGIGFNLERSDAIAMLTKVGADWKSVLDGTGELTDPQVDRLFDLCFEETIPFAKKVFPNWEMLLLEVWSVLVDMCFQMRARVYGFKHMREAIARLDYQAAMTEMRNSLYAKQCPGRVARNCAFIEAALPVSREGSV